MPESPTRGRGLLEGFLARKRAAMADRLIPENLRGGRILDIGCGQIPHFLLSTRFEKKYGLERSPQGPAPGEVKLASYDLEHDGYLPFRESSFDAVTMLAVFEHLDPDRLVGLLDDVHRVLRDGGIFVMTTPAGWTAPLLSLLGRAGVVSREEVDEHRGAYSHEAIRSVIASSRFDIAAARLGHFEAFMNNWATATKRAD